MAPKLCSHCQRHHPPAQLICPENRGMLDLVGRELDGRYRFKACIGQSDCAWVWRARHLKTKRRVAIKLLRPECLDDLALVTRLEQEGILGARVHSDEVVAIYDQGTSVIGPYVVMDWVQGESLAQRLSQDHAQAGPWSPAQVLRFSKALARALVAMHEAGVVHRDLKPSNVMVMGSGSALRIKVIDFGVAKGLLHPGSTAVGRALGTAIYMAPEQAQDAASVDERADLYAFGMIFNQLLAGQDTPPEPGGPHTHFDALAPAWRGLAADLLASEPELRPASAKVLLSRLDALSPVQTSRRRRVSASRSYWPWVVSGAAGLGLGLFVSASEPPPCAGVPGAPRACGDAMPTLALGGEAREVPRCLDHGLGPEPEPATEPKAPELASGPSAPVKKTSRRANVASAAALAASDLSPIQEAIKPSALPDPELPEELQAPNEVEESMQVGPLAEAPVKSSGLASEVREGPSPTQGLVHGGDGLWTSPKRSAPMGFFDARQYCQSLSQGAPGLSWRLASPQELSRWRGVKGIRQGWYWANELSRGKAVVVALPSNRRFLVRVRRRFIRPFCVAQYP